MLAAQMGWKRMVQRPLLGFAEGMLRYLARYHRAELVGEHHLPRTGALLVGNHGLYGYETPLFFWLLLEATGRYPVGLADKMFFRNAFTREVLPLLGGVEGTPDNAVDALRRDELVVCYPGGVREVFKSRAARYRLRWERSVGFARCAALAQAPVIAFAAQGVDDAFWVSDARLKLAGDDPRYHPPVGLPVPLPARFVFHLAPPLDPPSANARPEAFEKFRDRIAGRVRRLLSRACHA